MIKIDNIGIPYEIFGHILNFVDNPTLSKIALVCKGCFTATDQYVKTRMLRANNHIGKNLNEGFRDGKKIDKEIEKENLTPQLKKEIDRIVSDVAKAIELKKIERNNFNAQNQKEMEMIICDLDLRIIAISETLEKWDDLLAQGRLTNEYVKNLNFEELEHIANQLLKTRTEEGLIKSSEYCELIRVHREKFQNLLINSVKNLKDYRNGIALPLIKLAEIRLNTQGITEAFKNELSQALLDLKNRKSQANWDIGSLVSEGMKMLYHSGSYIHEFGHSVATSLCYLHANPSIIVNWNGGGFSSSQYHHGLTRFGNYLGKENADLVIMAAGPLMHSLGAMVKYSLGMRYVDYNLLIYFGLCFSGLWDTIKIFNYASHDLSQNKNVHEHNGDFNYLWRKGNIHPLLAGGLLFGFPNLWFASLLYKKISLVK